MGTTIEEIDANVIHSFIIKKIEAVEKYQIIIHTHGIRNYRVNKTIYENGPEEFMLQFSETFGSEIKKFEQEKPNNITTRPKFEYLLNYTLFSTTWRKHKIYLPIVYKMNTINYKLNTREFMKIFKFSLEGAFDNAYLQHNKARILPAKKEYHSILINDVRNYTPSDITFIDNVICYARLFNYIIEKYSKYEEDLIKEILQINKITFSENGKDMIQFFDDNQSLINLRFNSTNLNLVSERTNVNIISEIFKSKPRESIIIAFLNNSLSFENLSINHINKLYHNERAILIQIIELHIIKLKIIAPSMVVISSGVNQVTRCGYETNIYLKLHDMREQIKNIVDGNLRTHLCGLQTNSPDLDENYNEIWNLNFSSWTPRYLYDLIHLNETLTHPIPNTSYAHWMYINRHYGNMFIPITLNISSFFKKRKYKIYFSSVYEDYAPEHSKDCIWIRKTSRIIGIDKNENDDNKHDKINEILIKHVPNFLSKPNLDYLKILDDEYKVKLKDIESNLNYFSNLNDISTSSANVLSASKKSIKNADSKLKFRADSFLQPSENFDFVVCNNLTSNVAKSSDFVNIYELDFKDYSNPLLIIVKCGMYEKDQQVINNSFTLILHLTSISDDIESEPDESFITLKFICNSEYVLG
jgi:hypothetical protein